MRFWFKNMFGLKNKGVVLVGGFLSVLGGMLLSLLVYYEPSFAVDKNTYNLNEKKCLSCHTSVNGMAVKVSELFETQGCIECHLGYHEKVAKTDNARLLLVADNKTRPDKNIHAHPSVKKVKTYSKEHPPADMVYIEAGEFIMGTNERFPDEGPEHIASTAAYFIDINEVTSKQYYEFARKSSRPLPQLFFDGKIPDGKENHPVTYVDWHDASDYCAFVGKRLPTEQEWEKAARGTKGNNFPWGNEFDATKANTPQLGLKHTTPVGQFPQGKSPYGLNDMSGNVWEWVDAYYMPHPGNDIPDENYGTIYRLLKGGSWVDCSFYRCGVSAFSFNRSFFLANTKNKGFGFRCAASAS